MWTRQILPYLAALIAITVWSFLLTPLILRLSGVPVSINPRKRGKLRWDLRQSMLFGVVGWGVGMTFFGLTEKYVTWKLSGIPSDQPTLAGFGGLAIKWTLGGFLFGLLMYLANGKRNDDQLDGHP
jgi:hypothetical protein